MQSTFRTVITRARIWAIVIALAAIAVAMDMSATPAAEALARPEAALGYMPPPGTPEANAKARLKEMSDYMAGQKAFSFEYDTFLEVVTKEDQKLGLASSGRSEEHTSE